MLVSRETYIRRGLIFGVSYIWDLSVILSKTSYTMLSSKRLQIRISPFKRKTKHNTEINQRMNYSCQIGSLSQNWCARYASNLYNKLSNKIR